MSGRNRAIDERSRPNPSSLAIRSSSRAGTGAVRIVGGQWRRSLLLLASRAGLRPTPERVRETIFDWVMHLFGTVEGLEVLDLFAGSGALGFEAASRGAKSVVLVEKNAESARMLSETVRRLKGERICRVVHGDAFEFLQDEALVFDLVFIDPPYADELQHKAMVAAVRRLKPEGLIYVEHPDTAPLDLSELSLVCVRRGTAGQVVYELFARRDSLMAGLAKLPKEKLSKVEKAKRRKNKNSEMVSK